VGAARFTAPHGDDDLFSRRAPPWGSTGFGRIAVSEIVASTLLASLVQHG
jgi:hypothetical protein